MAADNAELIALKERADLLGIKYHTNVGVDTLRERVNSHLTQEDKPQPRELSAVEERRRKMVAEAKKLVRVRITNMNPARKEFQGEIISASNNFTGTIKRFVPFGVEWHVEQILLNAMRERMCQVFRAEKTKEGTTIKKPVLTPEFAIEVLPPLTEKELKELAAAQQARHAID